MSGMLIGYAVVTPDCEGIYLHGDLDTCKKYCRPGSVIVETVQYKAGVKFSFFIRKFYKPIEFRCFTKNILWLHFNFQFEYLNKYGKIIYRSEG